MGQGQRPDLAGRPEGAAAGRSRSTCRRRRATSWSNACTDPNDWYARTARRILAERRDPAVIPALNAMVAENDGRRLSGPLGAVRQRRPRRTTAAELLNHPNEDVRAWTVRLLGDAKQVAPSLRDPLVELAKSDPSPSSAASSLAAKRLPSGDALPILARADAAGRDAATGTYRSCYLVGDRAPGDRLPGRGGPGRGAGQLARGVEGRDRAKTLLERVARRLAAEPTAAQASSLVQRCWRTRRRGKRPRSC